jgi:hypothetical protein
MGVCGHVVTAPEGYGTCECHHVDPPESGCCEHHKKDYVHPEIPIFDHPSEPLAPGALYVPPFTPPSLGNKTFGLPQSPGYAVPPSNTVSGSPPNLGLPDEITPEPLEYFEREEDKFKLPKFKYEEVYDTLKDKIKEKIPLEFLDDFESGSSSGMSDLIIKIDFSLPEPFNLRIGPQQINVSEMITDFAESSYGNIIRLILLCCVCLYFIVSVFCVIFV